MDRQLWEYGLVNLGSDWTAVAIENKLNSLGNEGWELISVMRDKFSNAKTLYMKRPRLQELVKQ